MIQRKCSKKGQLEIPFHWIFIMIAGALILLFFVTLIFKQKAVSEEKISMQLISSIEEIFAGAGAGEEEAIHTIEIPKTEFNFICDAETGYSEYSIKGTGISRQTPVDAIFSPDVVKGKEIIIWSLPWSLPFKITNFLLVSSSDVKYVIYHSQAEAEFAEQIKADLPVSLSIDLIQQGVTIPNYDNYKVKFLFIGVDPTVISLTSLNKKPDKDVSAVKIESDHIKFYRKQGNSFVFEEKDIALYLPSYNKKDAIYYAAIFSENANQFKCNLKKILMRLKLVAEVYKERTSRISGKYNPNDPADICGKLFAPEGFNNLISTTNICLNNLDNNQCNYQRFFDSVEGYLGIRERNTKLQDNGCLLIY